MKSLAAVGFWMISVLVLGRTVAAEIQIISGRAMGTSYTLKLASVSETTSVDEASILVKDELERIEAIFSLYRPESELSRWNQAKSNEWIEVSDDLYLVCQFAIELSRETDGAFDATIRPILKLWQLDSLSPSWSPPSLDAIEECKKHIGYDKIELQTRPRAILKRNDSIQLDLNALVEGWAIDRIVSLLAARGFHNALFELGGEFGCLGKPTESTKWRVGIEDPRSVSRLISKVHLSSESLCTSGSTKQGREHNGNRYTHILDPRTGRPIDHDLVAVSVLHPNAMMADGWSTALLVMGPKEALAIAELKGLAVGFVRVTHNEIQVNCTANATDRFQIVSTQSITARWPTTASWPNRVLWVVTVFAILGFVIKIAMRGRRRP